MLNGQFINRSITESRGFTLKNVSQLQIINTGTQAFKALDIDFAAQNAHVFSTNAIVNIAFSIDFLNENTGNKAFLSYVQH